MPRGPKRKNEDVLVKSAEMIGWAIGGIEREIVQTRERLANLTAQAATLRAKLGTSAARGGQAIADAAAVASDTAADLPKRRTMSPEARQRISEMMKKKWAERRRAKKTRK